MSNNTTNSSKTTAAKNVLQIVKDASTKSPPAKKRKKKINVNHIYTSRSHYNMNTIISFYFFRSFSSLLLFAFFVSLCVLYFWQRKSSGKRKACVERPQILRQLFEFKEENAKYVSASKNTLHKHIMANTRIYVCNVQNATRCFEFILR